MGILTTAYAAPLDLLKYITRGHLTLDMAFMRTASGALVWKKTVFFNFDEEKRVDHFIFDKGFEDLMRAFDYCGFRSVSTKLQTGNNIARRNDETGFNEGWVITPSAVKSASKSLEKASLEGLYKKWAAARKKQQAEGYDIGSLDDLRLPHIEALKSFLKKAADEGSYMIIVQ
jgi:hypothetical protein